MGPLKLKEGQEKPKTKAPKIQRLVTPLVLQRARRVKALKRARIAKAKSDANDYAKLLALRQKEKKEQIISSSLVGLLERIHLGESAEEAKCLQIDDCDEISRGPLATQLLCQCEKKKIQFKFGFHCYS